MPEKTKQFIDKKHKESSGQHIENEHKFVHFDEGNTIPSNIAKCSQCYYACDTVCERCLQYYCSLECQKNDWPEHRYKCGKPIHLQKPPPSKQQIQADNSSKRAVMAKTPPSKQQIQVDNNSSQRPVMKKNNKTNDVDTSKETTIKISTEVAKKSKPIPKQLLSVAKNVNQQNPTSSKTHPQPANSQKIAAQHVENPSNAPSPQSSIVSKFSSSKKLPAALRSATQQHLHTQAASMQQQSTSSKSSPEQLSQSSSVSQSRADNSLDNSAETYKQNMPRSGNIVTMTAISKTNVVFIRSTTYEENLSYINTVDRLQTIGKSLPPLKTLPKSGEVVIIKFQEQFNRALVLSVLTPTKILIHFMDYGNIDQAKFEDLLQAPKELVFKPRHAIPVILKDVADVYMTQEIRKFMHAYLNNINLEVRYKTADFREDSNVYAVELIDATTQQNLNKIIIKLSKPTEPKASDELCGRDYLARKVLPAGRNVELIVMDNSLMCSGCISCTTKPYAIEIEKFKKDIQAYVESIPKEPYTPRVDELCIAQYDEDGLWYRGICLETVGDGYPSIHFFDYGNITTVPIESIRRYPRQFTYPMYTVDCEIEGLPEFCDDKIVERLEDLIPNGEIIRCENVVVDEETNFCILSLPSVIRNLNQLGLLNL